MLPDGNTLFSLRGQQFVDQIRGGLGVRDGVDETTVPCGQFGDDRVNGVGSGLRWCGQQDAGWHVIGAEATVGEEIKVCAGFGADAGQTLGGLIDF